MDGTKKAVRIGSLTVAVGLGLAVTTGQGAAHAETEPGGGTSASAERRSGPTSVSDRTTTRTSATRTRTAAESADQLTASEVELEENVESVVSDESDETVTVVEMEPSPGDLTYVEDEYVTENPGEETLPVDEAPVTELPIPNDGGSNPGQVFTPPVTVTPDDPGTGTGDTEPTEPMAPEPTAPPAPEPTPTPSPTPEPSNPTDPSTPGSGETPPPSADTPALSPIAALLAVPGRIVTKVLSWAGLYPTIAPFAPNKPLGQLLELAWMAMRRVKSFLFNTAPTATVTIDAPGLDGTISGAIVGADPNGDPIRYRLLGQPEHGTVVLAADGTFTYTPDPTATAAERASDSFRVAVLDNGFHLHGLLGLVTKSAGHTRTVTVNVGAPAGHPTFLDGRTLVDARSGRVTGFVDLVGFDPDRVSVSFGNMEEGIGQVTIARVSGQTWRWDFVPDEAIRPDEVPGSTTFTLLAEQDDIRATSTVNAMIAADYETQGASKSTIWGRYGAGADIYFGPGRTVVFDDSDTVLIVDPESPMVFELRQLGVAPALVHIDDDALQGVVSSADLKYHVFSADTLELTATNIAFASVPTDIAQWDDMVISAHGSELALHDPVSGDGRQIDLGRGDIRQIEMLVDDDLEPARAVISMIRTSGGILSIARPDSGLFETDAPLQVVDEYTFGPGAEVTAMESHGHRVFVTVADAERTRLIQFDATDGQLTFLSEMTVNDTTDSLAIADFGDSVYLVGDEGVEWILVTDDVMEWGDILYIGTGEIQATDDGGALLVDTATGAVTKIHPVGVTQTV